MRLGSRIGARLEPAHQLVESGATVLMVLLLELGWPSGPGAQLAVARMRPTFSSEKNSAGEVTPAFT